MVGWLIQFDGAFNTIQVISRLQGKDYIVNITDLIEISTNQRTRCISVFLVVGIHFILVDLMLQRYTAPFKFMSAEVVKN